MADPKMTITVQSCLIRIVETGEVYCYVSDGWQQIPPTTTVGELFEAWKMAAEATRKRA